MKVLSMDFTLTKRHLGVLVFAAGVLLLAAVAVAEAIRSGQFGILQKLAVLIGTLCVVVGITLWPLGSAPA